jgi:hypothetical protein
MSNQQVSLQLVRVHCVDETGGSFAEKFGNDEMALSGVGIAATGNTTMLNPIGVGANFDDGETVSFNPPKTLFRLAVPEVGAFPKTCTVSLILAEEDAGSGHRNATQKAFEAITKNIKAAKADMIAKGEEPSDTGDWWDPIVDEVRDILKKLVTDAIADDVFPMLPVSVEISSPDFRFGNGTKLSDEEIATFTAHRGKYQVVYNWLVETAA